MTGAGRRRPLYHSLLAGGVLLVGGCQPAPRIAVAPVESCSLPVEEGVRPDTVYVSTDQLSTDPAPDPTVRFLAAARSTDAWRDCGGQIGRSLGGQAIAFRPLAGDPRDLLDGTRGRVDLLFTREPRVIEYARARPAWAVVPLPFDRRYVLVTMDTLPAGATVGSALVEAVQREARAPGDQAACPGSSDPGGGQWRGEVLYLAADPTARDLATRIVALAALPSPPRWLPRPWGLLGRQLRIVAADTAALRTGAVAGSSRVAVVADPVEGCASLLLPDAATRLPLVETRAHLVVRQGLGPLVFDDRGTVRLAPGGRR